MPSILPPEPEFGAPCPQTSSPETLNLLALRRSTSAAKLQAPGPDADQLADLLRLAARAPDHGKLFPWRFIVIEGEAKAKALEGLQRIARETGENEAALFKFAAPPMAVVVASHVTPGKIPEWEQVLSAGAVCQTLLIAATAMGFGANWITDWYAYSDAAKAVLGVEAGERVAGVIYLGTSAEAPLERVRPDVSAIITQMR